MIQNLFDTFMKKSLKKRFILFIGILFVLICLALGLIIICWTEFPLKLETNYRIAFGLLLIGYAAIRFLRFFNSNK